MCPPTLPRRVAHVNNKMWHLCFFPLAGCHALWQRWAMTDTEFLRSLGSAAAVAELLGAKRSAVSMWIVRDSIPTDYHIALWRLAQDRGLSWRPPGADSVEIINTNNQGSI